jgi:DNA-binding CsgD family transcriptional regulator
MDIRLGRSVRGCIARIFKEVYKQGAVLSNADVALFVGVSPSTVSKQAREFMEREKVVLPTRGTVHDLGMALTHKRIVLMLYLSGHLTSDISRITGHSEEVLIDI